MCFVRFIAGGSGVAAWGRQGGGGPAVWRGRRGGPEGVSGRGGEEVAARLGRATAADGGGCGRSGPRGAACCGAGPWWRGGVGEVGRGRWVGGSEGGV